MARRRIGQEKLGRDADRGRRSGSLEEIAGLIDWAEIDRHLLPIMRHRRGSRPGRPWPCSRLFC